MKRKLLITAFLIASLLGTFSLKSQQHLADSVHDKRMQLLIDSRPKSTLFADSVLIADETWLTYSKTGANIVTFSEDVFNKISLKWPEGIDSIDIKYKMGNGVHTRKFIIYSSTHTGNNIRQWAKKNL